MSKTVELVKMAMTGDAHAFKAAFENTMAARISGLVEREYQKMTESVVAEGKDEDDKEELDELSQGKKLDYAAKAVMSISDTRERAKKRMERHGSLTHSDRAGLEKAKQRQKFLKKALNKEEVEQVDEISKGRLGDYIRHSSMNKSSHANDIGYENGSGVEAGYKDHERQAHSSKQHGKRSLGINRAVDKLTGQARVNAKEEVEQVSESREAEKGLHNLMLKALGKSSLPKDHQYSSDVATNGDFVVRDGGSRIVGRIKKGEHNADELASKIKR